MISQTVLDLNANTAKVHARGTLPLLLSLAKNAGEGTWRDTDAAFDRKRISDGLGHLADDAGDFVDGFSNTKVNRERRSSLKKR